MKDEEDDAHDDVDKVEEPECRERQEVRNLVCGGGYWSYIRAEQLVHGRGLRVMFNLEKSSLCVRKNAIRLFDRIWIRMGWYLVGIIGTGARNLEFEYAR